MIKRRDKNGRTYEDNRWFMQPIGDPVTTVKEGARKAMEKLTGPHMDEGEARLKIAGWMQVSRTELADDLDEAGMEAAIAEERYANLLEQDEPYSAEQSYVLSDAYNNWQDAAKRVERLRWELAVFDQAVEHLLDQGWVDLEELLGVYAEDIRRRRLRSGSQEEFVETLCGPMRRGYIPPECMPEGVDLNALPILKESNGST